MYVTGCDLQKSFVVGKTVEITSHVNFQIHVLNVNVVHDTCYISEIWELERFQTAKVAFGSIEGNRYCCHSIGQILFPIRLPVQMHVYVSVLYRV